MRAEVWAAPNSPLVGFPEDHPLFRGHLVLTQKGLAEQLSPYDVVLVLGAQVFQYYPYVPGPVVEEGTQLVQITEDFEEANRAATGTSLVGDVGVAIRQLTELLPETERQAPPQRSPRRQSPPRRYPSNTLCMYSQRFCRKTRWSPTSRPRARPSSTST